MPSWESLRTSREVRRYSRTGLRQLLTSVGFSIVRLTTRTLAASPPMFIGRSIQRLRGLSIEDTKLTGEITIPSRPVNALLTAALRLESVWLRVFDNPFGSSLLCLARKPWPSGRPS